MIYARALCRLFLQTDVPRKFSLEVGCLVTNQAVSVVGFPIEGLARNRHAAA